jgi:hypothetical protein
MAYSALLAEDAAKSVRRDDSLSEELPDELKSKHFLHLLVPSCTEVVRRNVLRPYAQPHVVRHEAGMLWSSTDDARCKIRARGRKTKVSPGRVIASRSLSSSALRPLSPEADALGLAAFNFGPSGTAGSGQGVEGAAIVTRTVPG